MIIKPPIASCVRQLSPFLRYVVILIPLQNTKAGKKIHNIHFSETDFQAAQILLGHKFHNSLHKFRAPLQTVLGKCCTHWFSQDKQADLKLWFKLVKLQSIDRQLRTVQTALTRWNCFHCHFDRYYCSIRSITIALDDHDRGKKIQ